MNVSRHFRLTFLAVFALLAAVALSSCSKKDVRQDEPAITPSPDSGTMAGTEGGVGTEGAGEAGATSTALSTVYFPFDSFSLSGEARSVLKTNDDWLKGNPNVSIQIEGHCDERGTTEYNLALGERRANAARDYLLKLGVPRNRLSVISYGEERPSDPGHDESAWGRNRRAEFVPLSR